MKIVSYALHGTHGASQWGVVVGDRVVSGNRLVGGPSGSLVEAIASGALQSISADTNKGVEDQPLDRLRLLPVIPNPAKFFGAGLNYRAHIDETGHESPQDPRFFVRIGNSLCGHGQPVVRPVASEQLDFEGELAVVIGKPGRHIPIARALEHVFGYTCFMDGSVRDFQKHSVTSGKNFLSTGALGPWLVTADEVGDPAQLELRTRLNGELVQSANTRNMIYTIPEMIAYLSTITLLEPGDVIATGTPEGVGARRKPPLWMKSGDRIEVEIENIGVLSNPVVDESELGAGVN